MRIHEIISEDWQKANKKDKTAGMSQTAVNAYRRENPGSKLKTAVTKDPSKLKKGSADDKRRSSFCARSNGQRKMHNIDCSKTQIKQFARHAVDGIVNKKKAPFNGAFLFLQYTLPYR